MDNKEFYKIIKELANNIDIEISEEQSNKLYMYMKELIEWNEKMNLTAITDEKEIILKHFIDSMTILKYTNGAENMIDIGTGAGFPGIPICIMNNNINITLLDSLNKRIIFLNNIIEKLELKNIKAIHGRAEDLAKNNEHRQKYDIVTSRAVAPLNVLIEYMVPFNKIKGKSICMKGSNIEEVKEAEKALDILGCRINDIDKIILPSTNIERNIVVIEKEKETPKKYPRKAGMPKKEPL